MICLFICVPLAEAKQTHLAVQVQNNTGYEMTLVKSGDWSGKKSIRARDYETLQHKNTAYYMKTKQYDHDIVVKKGGNSYCKCDIWLKNKVTLVGDTKIIDEHYKSNNTKRCVLKEVPAGVNHALVLDLYIK